VSVTVGEGNAWRAPDQEEQILSEYNRPPVAAAGGGAVGVFEMGARKKGQCTRQGDGRGCQGAWGSDERCVQEK